MSLLIGEATNCNNILLKTLNTSTWAALTKKPWLPQEFMQQQAFDAKKLFK